MTQQDREPVGLTVAALEHRHTRKTGIHFFAYDDALIFEIDQLLRLQMDPFESPLIYGVFERSSSGSRKKTRQNRKLNPFTVSMKR
ncbi:MAG: hypothetical protein KDJ29_18005 [Hyphomicrobiales bacterium]|nr:hypothetical protein [Hyphomicrobiales bacterium]